MVSNIYEMRWKGQAVELIKAIIIPYLAIISYYDSLSCSVLSLSHHVVLSLALISVNGYASSPLFCITNSTNNTLLSTRNATINVFHTDFLPLDYYFPSPSDNRLKPPISLSFLSFLSPPDCHVSGTPSSRPRRGGGLKGQDGPFSLDLIVPLFVLHVSSPFSSSLPFPFFIHSARERYSAPRCARHGHSTCWPAYIPTPCADFIDSF